MGEFHRGSKITRKTEFVLLLLIFAVVLFHHPIASQNLKNLNLKQSFDTYYQIRKLEIAGSYEEALLECRRLIEQSPDFYSVYQLYVRISKKNDTLEDSSDFFRGLIEKDPERTTFYYGLGLCHKEQKELERAREVFKQAIERRSNYIFTYYELLVSASTKEECQEMIDFFEEQSKHQPANSYLFYAIAAIYQYKLGQFDAALDYFLKAVEVARVTGNKLEEGQHLNMIGNLYWNRSDFSKALEYYLKAVEAIRKTDVKTQWISYLYNTGLMYCYLSQPLKGREYYHQALKAAREIGHKEEEAKILRSIGFTHTQVSEYMLALNYYQDALEIAQDISDQQRQTQCFLDIADIHWKRGNFARANERFQDGLVIARVIGDRNTEFWALNGMGNVFLKTGDFSKALDHYLQAFEVNKQLKMRYQDAVLLNNIANIYTNIGDHTKALDYYQQALDIHKETGSKGTEGITLSNIATLYFERKESAQALSNYRQALQIARDTGDRREEATRLNYLANVYSYLGDFLEAHKFYDEALILAQNIGTKEIEADVYRDRGHMFDLSGDYPKAQESFLKAISLGQEIGYAQKTWAAQAGLAAVYEKQDRYQEALEHYKKAIDQTERLRSQFQLEEHKSGFLSNKIEVYISLANLLFRLYQKQPAKGFGEESFYYAEKARARAFLDALREGRINLRKNLHPDLRNEEDDLLSKISTLQTELAKPQVTNRKRDELLNELEKAEEDYFSLIQKMKRINPEYVQIVYPEPHRLDTIQENLLNEDTAILEYLLGEDKAFLFCVTKNDFSIHSLSASEDLNERTNDYINLLKTGAGKKFEAFRAGERLYQELIGPVRDKLKTVKRLIIIPDGNLNFLPFEALVATRGANQSRFLVSDFRMSYAPSSTALVNLLERKERSAPRKALLAFANPEYGIAASSGEKVDANHILREFYLGQEFDFSPLKYSVEEVNQIAKLIKRKKRDVYSGRDATEERIKSLPLADYSIIHFATHGFIDEKVPLRSSVLLSLDEDPAEDGFFQSREIYNIDLAAKLVVLSACQTGRGRLVRGEGVMGLSRAFFYAGAESVVASLWSINDKATSVFMKYFYESLSQGMSKEEALRKAKLDMIGSPYQHPFYWASFVLSGESQNIIKIEKPSFWERIF